MKNRHNIKKDFTSLFKISFFLSKRKSSFRLFVKFILPITICTTLLSGCGIYSFRDAVIPDNIKTIKIGFIENKARYVNPQLAPLLTDKLQQKIMSQTKLTRTNNDDAHYQIFATITNYDPSQTVGVSAQQASTNRLTVTVHVLLKKTLDNKEQEFDVTRNFDFSATLTLNQAEGQLMEEILRNITDDIFNQIFSNW